MTWMLMALLPAISPACGGDDAGEPIAVTEMVEVRSGLTFVFGSQDFCAGPATPQTLRPNCDSPIPGGFPLVAPSVEVTLEPFAIDQHEVTNAQYLDCVKARACTDLADYSGLSPDQDFYYGADWSGHFPVNKVTWHQADSYCRFVGKRLPSEVEWERVARGDADAGIDRPFPAEGIDALADCQASLGAEWALAFCSGDESFFESASSNVDFVVENGKRVHDLLGNVAEWTDTWAKADMGCKAEPPCKRERDCLSNDDACIVEAKTCPSCISPDDCHFMCEDHALQTIVCTPFPDSEQPVAARLILPDGGSEKVIRGGSVVTNEVTACRMRSTRPNDKRGVFSLLPSSREAGVGFRCARSL